MSSGKREKYGITPIEEVIGYFDNIGSEISANDKTPSWDGEIFIYNNSKHPKESLEGRFPVQVKSKEVKQFNGNTQKFTLYKSDLRNYLNDGGVIFFWVEYIRSNFRTESKIYLKTLLPIDIKDILKRMGNQKTIKEEFIKLYDQDLELICRDFLFHRKKQNNNLLNFPVGVEFDEYKGYIIGKELADIERRFFNEGTYVYGKINKYNLMVPLHKFKADARIELVDFNIGTKDKVYYKSIEREISPSGRIVKFGKSFTMTFPNKDKFNIVFKDSGNLKERIKDNKFFLEALKAKKLHLNNSPVPINIDKKTRSQHLEKIPRTIKNLEEISETFDKVGIDPKEDFGEFIKDIERILYLKDVILKRNKDKLKITKKNFQLIKFANYEIILARVGEESKGELINFFNFEEVSKKYRIVVSPDKTLENIAEHSPYIAFDVDRLYSYSNLKVDSIEKSLLNAEYDKDFSFTLTNEFLLNTITYCDDHQTSNNKAILKMIYNVYNKLEDIVSDKLLCFINKLQAAKRYRELTQEEIELIVEYKNNKNRDDLTMICALNILLDNTKEFEVSFNKLSDDGKKSIAEYPIYNLIKTRESESKRTFPH